MSESSAYAAASAAASAEGSAAPAIAIVSRDWLWRWGVLAILAAVDGAWLMLAGFHVDRATLADMGRLYGAILAAGGVFYAVGRRLRNPRMSRLLLSAADFFLSMIQLLIFFPLAVVLSYLFTSLDLPLQDGVFLRLDALPGFDWTAVAAWVRDHALLTEVMAFAYFSLFTQNQIVLFLGSGDRPGDTNGDFIWPAMISAVLCAAIAGVVPALGHQGFIGPAPIQAIVDVRAGAWTTVDICASQGIVTFPSYHAALAVIFTYAVRRIPWAFAVLAPFNALVILSTPTVGGHYLVDTIAGCLLAAASIALTRLIRARLA